MTEEMGDDVAKEHERAGGYRDIRRDCLKSCSHSLKPTPLRCVESVCALCKSSRVLRKAMYVQDVHNACVYEDSVKEKAGTKRTSVSHCRENTFINSSRREAAHLEPRGRRQEGSMLTVGSSTRQQRSEQDSFTFLRAGCRKVGLGPRHDKRIVQSSQEKSLFPLVVYRNLAYFDHAASSRF